MSTLGNKSNKKSESLDIFSVDTKLEQLEKTAIPWKMTAPATPCGDTVYIHGAGYPPPVVAPW